MPPFAPIPVRGGHHHGERLRAAGTLLRGVFAGTIKAGAGVMTPGLFNALGASLYEFFLQIETTGQSTFFGSLL